MSVSTADKWLPAKLARRSRTRQRVVLGEMDDEDRGLIHEVGVALDIAGACWAEPE